MYYSDICFCDHSKNMHNYDKELKKHTDCLWAWHDGPCTCRKFRPKPLEPARFDLNGLILRG